MPRAVTMIPATKNIFNATPINSLTKRRVAGYARVSTDSDEQFTSYEAQIDYYTKYIKSHDDWQFAHAEMFCNILKVYPFFRNTVFFLVTHIEPP